MTDQVSQRDEGAEAAQPQPQPQPQDGRAFRPTATLLISIFIVAVIVVATAVVLYGGQGQQVSYPPGSPEAAVQGYLRASYDKDLNTAYGYFSSRVKARTSLERYLSDDYCCYGYDERQNVRLDRVSGTGNRRTVYLLIDTYYGDGSEPYTRPSQVPLVLEDNEWHIDQLMRGAERVDDSF